MLPECPVRYHGMARHQILMLKCTKFDLQGALPQTPLGELTAVFKGPTSKGRVGEGKERERKERIRERRVAPQLESLYPPVHAGAVLMVIFHINAR